MTTDANKKLEIFYKAKYNGEFLHSKTQAHFIYRRDDISKVADFTDLLSEDFCRFYLGLTSEIKPEKGKSLEVEMIAVYTAGVSVEVGKHIIKREVTSQKISDLCEGLAEDIKKFTAVTIYPRLAGAPAIAPLLQ